MLDLRFNIRFKKTTLEKTRNMKSNWISINLLIMLI